MQQEKWTPRHRPPGLERWLTLHFSFGAKVYRLSQLGFPFIILTSGNSTMGRVRTIARRGLWMNRPLMQRWLICMAMIIGWPFGAIVEVIRGLRTMPPAKRPTGVLELAQRSLHMLSLALLRNVPPREYVAYQLHLPKRKDWIDGALYNPERIGLMALLNHLQDANQLDVQDKGRFTELCQMHALPCIPTLALFRNGQMELPYHPEHSSIWSKDLCGSHGSGGTHWRRDGALYCNDKGQRLGASELVAEWRKRDCIVQPCLDNHPLLESLSDGSLVDFRIVTGIARDGTVTVLANLAALPCGGPERRRFILGPVDANNCRIFSARLGRFQLVDVHPDSGVVISDVTIPFWREAMELAKRAHAKAFASFVFLGWDIAITTDGPLLIETNSGWSAYNHQVAGDEPLGCTAFADITLQHLEQLKCV